MPAVPDRADRGDADMIRRRHGDWWPLAVVVVLLLIAGTWVAMILTGATP